MGYSVDMMITGLNRGGAETQFARLAVGLAERGWNVHVRTLLEPAFFLDDLHAVGVNVTGGRAMRGRPEVGPALEVARAVRRARPDVLVSFLFHPNMLSRLIGLMTQVPVVNSVRGERFGDRLRERALRWTSFVPAHTVVNSARALDRLVLDGLVRPESSSLIVNGLDVTPFHDRSDRAATRASLGVTEADYLWLAVGRIEPPKDYRRVLNAFSSLSDAGGLSQQLVIAGDGPQRVEMELHARSLGVDDRVQFLGIREDVPRLMVAADAFVFASDNEGLPNVIMEAQAAGLPVVATAVGGVPELIRDGKTGWLVRDSSPEALADAMSVVLADRVGSHHIGKQAAAEITMRFGVERYIGAWEALLRRIIASEGQRVVKS